MGRPKKDGQKKDHIVAVRLTNDEFTKVNALAARSTMSVSDVIREGIRKYNDGFWRKK